MGNVQPLITTKAAALRMGICERQVRSLISSGELPVVPLGNSARGYRLNPVDIESYIKKITIVVREERKWPSTKEGKPTTRISGSKASELDALLGRKKGGQPKGVRTK